MNKPFANATKEQEAQFRAGYADARAGVSHASDDDIYSQGFRRGSMDAVTNLPGETADNAVIDWKNIQASG